MKATPVRRGRDVQRAVSPSPHRGERGAAALEFALLVPLLILVAGVVVGGGRVQFARSSLDQLAGSAARAASASASGGIAVAAAQALVHDQASRSGLSCSNLGVDVDVSGFGVQAGVPGSVVVTVTCTVPLADLIVPGWPGSIDLTGHATSVVDTYRRR